MNILIGITAGISAYKIPELIRLFVKENHNVKVILTTDAENFVTKTTLQTLSKNKVYTEAFDLSEGAPHIELAKWADIFIVAPATADFLAKLTYGLASSLLYSTLLAYKKKCLIFPSMNVDMLNNCAVKENIEKLKSRGFLIYKPETGELACGTKGTGRLPEPEIIFDITKLEAGNLKKDLINKKVLITAGSTKAYIDKVRFITNGSSGKMGLALVKEAFTRGAEVTFACNKELIEKHNLNYFVKEIIFLDTTDTATDLLEEDFKNTDIYISACAYCDYKSINLEDKLKRSNLKLELEASSDVFSNLSKIKTKQLMIGFALEANNLESKASFKLKNKNMDFIVANDLTIINNNTGNFTIIDKNLNSTNFKNISKQILAKELFNKITESV